MFAFCLAILHNFGMERVLLCATLRVIKQYILYCLISARASRPAVSCPEPYTAGSSMAMVFLSGRPIRCRARLRLPGHEAEPGKRKPCGPGWALFRPGFFAAHCWRSADF